MFVLGTKGDRLLSSRHSWRFYGQTVEKRSRYSSRVLGFVEWFRRSLDIVRPDIRSSLYSQNVSL
jgi:hypothetical protein